MSQVDIPTFAADDFDMPGKTSLNVSLTPQLQKFVHKRVSSGRYQTASEVVREGLRLLERHEQDREAALQSLRAQLNRGAAQADRGEFVSPASVLDKIKQRKRQRTARKVP